MELTVLVQRLCLVEMKRLVLLAAISISVVLTFQYFVIPYKTMQFSHEVSRVDIFVDRSNNTKLEGDTEFDVEDEAPETNIDYDLLSDDMMDVDTSVQPSKVGNFDSRSTFHNSSVEQVGIMDADLKPSANSSSKKIAEMQDTTNNAQKLQIVSVSMENSLKAASDPALKRLSVQQLSISQMNSLLAQSFVSSKSMRLKRYSTRNRELLSAKLEIEKAPTAINIQELQSYVFQNVSRFIRSYELMERVLKIYVYKEGEKPVFHQPKMRGIYASEGWFMKLMEGNKKFVVRDPKKAHLFYIPFSSQALRNLIDGHKFHSHRDLEKYLKSYIDLIARKYRFWNQAGGTDHFVVACHDWASRITSQQMGNCIRALCNANAAKGFQIGKDTSLPVTYIRSAQNPVKDLGGKPPSERNILAFFAGNMHGYLRPILRQYWEDKEPDMKIFGPISHNNITEGKRIYREYMKSSKYCVCARGYEVHTPRVVEAIFYECVPVIISDNYVPPFFEVLNWEAFAVFVRERDIPNLREILVSISEEQYLRLQHGVKMVQQHFMWHKQPVKYDLFHMVLHSVWHNRILQLKPR